MTTLIPLAQAATETVSLTWHPHPDVWLLVVVLSVGYVWALRVLGPRHVHPVERPASPGQVTAFMLGVGVLWVASDWPMHDLAEGYLYSVHMVQHMLLSLVAPPLLLLGTPAWLFRALLPGPLMPLVRMASKPLIALALFNGVVVFTHWPLIVEASARSELAHFSVHVLVFFTAMAMWMPVLSPVMEIPRLPYPGQMAYLFLQSLVPTVPASFLTFTDHTIYRVYAEAPRLIAALDPLTDQRVAGLVMKLAGGAILWGVIAVLFFKWFAKEEREGVDVLSWHSVDRELNKVSTRGGAR